MVRALLEGRKTQTRRIMKPQPESGPGMNCTRIRYKNRRGDIVLDEALESQHCCQALCPYGVPGDRLWVRETFWYEPPSFGEVCGIKYQDGDEALLFRADGEVEGGVKWKPSIFMPRLLSRITLDIAEVRVQRLQDISEEDAEAEGLWRGRARRHLWWLNATDCRLCEPFHGHKPAYQYLWQSINGPGSWDANPWVWAITFTKVQP